MNYDSKEQLKQVIKGLREWIIKKESKGIEVPKAKHALYLLLKKYNKL